MLLKFFIILMIMSNDFQFQYAHHFSLPYISYKMKCASIILDAIYKISLLITSSFSFISPSPSAQIFVDKWRHLARI